MKIFLGLLLLFLTGCTQSKKGEPRILLQKQDWNYQISLRGEIASSKESLLSCPDNLGGVIKQIPEHGTHVKKGELIIEIDAQEAIDRLKNTQRSLARAKKRLSREIRDVEKQKLQLEIEVLEKEFSWKLKNIEVDFSLGEKDPKVLKTIDLRVDLLKEELKVLDEKLKNFQTLADNQSLPTKELEQVKKDLKITKLQQELEKTEKDLKITGTTGERREKAFQELELLKLEWERAVQNQKDKEKNFPLLIEKRELVVQKQQKDLERMENHLNKSKLYAPQDGVFYQMKHPWDGTYIERGDQVWRRMIIGKVVDLQSLQALLKADEKDIDKIEIGQKVNFTTTKNSTISYDATIAHISAMANYFNPTDKKSKKFHWVRLDLNSNLALSPGESLEATIFVTSRSNIFVIPTELVKIHPKTISLQTADKEIHFTDFTLFRDIYLVNSEQNEMEVLYAKESKNP